ncbi:MAG: hypothetical protein ACLU9Q_12055 [Marvinbryantia sp.]|uniref:hypothetical protein n=1 Tax=Marvinbryantia sp. TaxID=2496532 RepID=UPI0025DB7A04|nr:hypothetical protein [uncultured Marvinbryantia sp.]
MDRKKSCNCIRQCPCYPKCDQMMDEGQIPGAIPPSWLRTEPPRQMKDMEGTSPQGVPYMETMPQPGASRMDSSQMPQSDARSDSGTVTQMEPRLDSRAVTQMEPRLDSRARVSDDILLEEENERDWQKLKEMYPEIAKIIMVEVERVCDSMEYEGSMMFDTMPDRVRIRMLTDDIYDKVKDRYPVEETNDQDDMFSMNQEGRRRYPPRQNWLGDFIQVLLFQEMHHRRCRNRRCRHW